MTRVRLIALLGCALAPPVASPALAQAPANATGADSSAAWFARHVAFITLGGGRWITDNSRYRGPNEPWVTYGLEWKRGLSPRTASGRLFGRDSLGREEGFWEFFMYWDPIRERGVVVQLQPSGAFGSGDVAFTSATEHVMDQDFLWADGSRTRVRHRERQAGDEQLSESLNWENDKWTPGRQYVWKRTSPRP